MTDWTEISKDIFGVEPDGDPKQFVFEQLYESGRDLILEYESGTTHIIESERLTKCEVCGTLTSDSYDKHHTSYYPEETIMVCVSCHRKIHMTDGYHDELKPERERPEDYNSKTRH